MVNEQLRQDLLAMRAGDRSVRQELIDSRELGGSYVPRMGDVHRKNAARLREFIELYGWPAEDIVRPFGNRLLLAHQTGTRSPHILCQAPAQEVGMQDALMRLGRGRSATL
jgi:hypothetical protein